MKIALRTLLLKSAYALDLAGCWLSNGFPSRLLLNASIALEDSGTPE